MLKIQEDFSAYLSFSHYINGNDVSIQRKAIEIKNCSQNEIELVKNTYDFVRDEIKHSWDIQDKRVTVTATDVLREKVGICYAKANLLTALLRVNKIPTGICYQRLTLGDTPERGYCIHALNAVYIKMIGKWIRLDARGNKDSVNAEFSLDREQLAFQIRTEYDEIDYKTVYSEPLKMTMDVLESNTDALYMYLHALPERI